MDIHPVFCRGLELTGPLSRPSRHSQPAGPADVSSAPLLLPAHFQRALAWVAERYDDVLDEPQRRFVADYAALPQPSQALLARLLRRGPWFRASGLI